uniref:Response regulator receiver domain-containing protein n=1 Tax=Candidatus Kentrum sp. DK TaxID=2126562 RepID=A0A450SD03_9GAMM|nr:MAG: Response regulator receiver domain-containing protein [Candidatus Kentron sp. DK]
MNKGKILIVDDEEEIVEQFARALKGQGYAVEPAYSGEEAWDKYQGQYFDVVLADWKMGKMNGLELLKKIDDNVPHSQVIMITAFGDEDCALEAHHYHAFDFLKKPVDRQTLIDAVGKAIERRDPIIRTLENWVEENPEEADAKISVDFSNPEKPWSVRDTLEAIRHNTPWGREQYEEIIDLTIYLMTRGEVDRRKPERA